ncbi:hypothetical protein [Petrachloros mirabilis]
MAALSKPSVKLQDSAKARLETQIHRRKKAKPFSSLLAEWDQTDQDTPVHLRMDSARMAQTSGSREKID